MPDFPLWPQCNIGCVFCSNPVEGYRETTEKYSFEELKKKVAGYKKGAKTFLKFDEVRDYFNLTGGEPTIHPEFHKVLAHIRQEFPVTLIRLLTNGRMLSYPDFARRTCGIAQTPFEFAVPLFGYDPKTHESISRTPKSFEQTTAGLRNLKEFKKPGQIVEVRVILTKIQVKYLDGMLDMLLAEFPWIDRLTFLFVELEGFADQFQKRLMFKMTDCAEHLDRNYDKLVQFKDVRFYHFPLCVLPTRLWPFVWNTLADFKVTYFEECRTQCTYKEQCVGVHRSYERYMGAPDITPITEKRNVELSGDKYHPISAYFEEVAKA
jgi:molybdenum cofactor biosynthesis enzyme MoaA